MEILKVNDNKSYYKQVAQWIYDAFVSKKTPEFKPKMIEEKLQSKTSFISLTDGIPSGTISIFENDLESRKDLTPWLASLYVEPQFRGQGIAEKLIEAVRLEVKEQGFDKVYLRTTTASKYYEKLGWTKIDTVDEKLEKNIDVFEIKV